MISFLGEDWTRMTKRIESSLTSDISLLDKTNKTILANGGKKLRPLVSLLMARACSGGCVTNESLDYAAAVELLHNATLIHDDVADESMVRRGAPTVYASLGQAASVLIGDFWLVQTMKCILSCGRKDDRIADLFSSTLRSLAEGEMLQLEKTTTADTSEEEYLRIIYSKTASLFETASACAAISVNAAEEIVEAAKEYGKNLGLAFQIKDDIMDYESSDTSLGKPVGVDLMEKKITLPLLGALEAVNVDEEKEIRKMVAEIDSKPENIEGVRQFVFANDGIQCAKNRLQEYVEKAVAALSILPDSREKEYLTALAGFSADRKI